MIEPSNSSLGAKLKENWKFLNFGPLNNNSKLGFIAAPVPLVIASPAFTLIPTLPSAYCARNDDSARLAGVPVASSLLFRSFIICPISFDNILYFACLYFKINQFKLSTMVGENFEIHF